MSIEDCQPWRRTRGILLPRYQASHQKKTITK